MAGIKAESLYCILDESGTQVTTQLLGVKGIKKKKQEEPFWKRRIEGKMKAFRKDVSLIERWQEANLRKLRNKVKLEHFYHPYKRLAEERQQRIKAKAATVNRYTDRVKQYRQNILSQSNQSRFYQNLEEKNHEQNVIPDKDKSREFWAGIWEKDVKHNNNAEWIDKVGAEMKPNKLQNIELTPMKVRKKICGIANWKAPEPGGAHTYWIKGFESLHERIGNHLQHCVKEGSVPE